jgi:uncharacterized protein (DUF427 family)
MGLMTGSGPFGRKPAGKFNFDPPAPGTALYIDPCPKRVRVVVAGETIADSRATWLVHESGHQPVYYFPAEDVDAAYLQPSDRHTHCPKKGDASYHTIKVGERIVENGAWYYPEPLPGAEPIAGMVAFYWNRMDSWLEEDEEVFVHPRDPYHRVDIVRSSRHIRISLDGELLAESTTAMALFETNLPTRWYIRREDIVAELIASDLVTGCPYKGKAGYHSVRLQSGEEVKDLVWCYAEPLDGAARIAGLHAFYDERVDVELDGERQARPESPWSHAGARAANLPPAQTRG